MLLEPSSHKILFCFRYFSLYTGSVSNHFLIPYLTLSQILLYFSSNFSSFIKKDIYLISLKLFVCPLLFGSTIHNG